MLFKVLHVLSHQLSANITNCVDAMLRSVTRRAAQYLGAVLMAVEAKSKVRRHPETCRLPCSEADHNVQVCDGHMGETEKQNSVSIVKGDGTRVLGDRRREEQPM